MANIHLIFPLLFISCFIFPSTTNGYSNAIIKAWCTQTPHPQPCEYFLSQNPKITSPIVKKSDFLKVSLDLVLDRALRAQLNTYSLGPKCRNEREKNAWADCIELYENSINKIKSTVDPNTKCSATDAQTWLSTALTNLETCKAGFEELGVTDYVMPLMSNNNVSSLISNALALNHGYYTEPTKSSTSTQVDGFPTWVSPGDRKLLQSSSSSTASQANVVVATDGSGDFKTVKEAVDAAAKNKGSGRFVIYVKAGTYNENVEIGEKVKNVMLIGDGIGKTIITGSKSVGGGSTTFRSATVGASGDGFIAQGITIRNTAGPQKHQAVALRSGSDLSVFYQCSFEGYQDTLYVHSNRQFYKECDIYGTVDFIFGNAAVVLQNCNIFARDPPNKINTVTAQGRTDPNQNTGISIHNCRITGAGSSKSARTYLGRPWQKYSRTVVMKTFLDGLISSEGWLPWSGNFALNTLYYGEYLNTGPGSSTGNRVNWGGYRVITSSAEASKFTPANFIAGNSWIPATNVPFTSGL
ncbi:pectinesterase 2 [Solanum lycopersicum]|uniref:Pectinesterase n=1 Tax=Solanum lycopersicum TaxID=4081 RepID=A0A3Q7EL18_SOLLC|nr:pectinesterase 2 [Solanum lycopersicum]